MPAPDGIYIGIDPGVSGGMVAISRESITVFSSVGKNAYDIRNWIEYQLSITSARESGIHILIEEVGGFIGGEQDGQKRNIAAAHTTFVLGESFGMLQMALVCARLSFRMIRPQEWQKRLNIRHKLKGEKPNQFKNRLKKYAQMLFPEEKITLQTSDAFLLAYLCRSLNT